MQKQIVQLIGAALKVFDDPKISDVTIDGDSDDLQITLTTDDGQRLRKWVIDENGIIETELEPETF